MKTSIFLRYFGGIVNDNTWGDIPVIPLGQWLLPIAICLLLQGLYMEKSRKINIFLEYRCGAIVCWWHRKYLLGLVRGTFISLGLIFAFIVLDIARREFSLKELPAVIVLWYLHMLTMQSMYLWMDLLSLRKLALAALLLLEGFTFLIGHKFQTIGAILYGTWGMYYRSSWYDRPQGFSSFAVILVEIALIMLGYYIGKILVTNQTIYENKEMEG